MSTPGYRPANPPVRASILPPLTRLLMKSASEISELWEATEESFQDEAWNAIIMLEKLFHGDDYGDLLTDFIIDFPFYFNADLVDYLNKSRSTK